MIREQIKVNDSLLSFGTDCFLEALEHTPLSKYSSVFVISQQNIWDLHGAPLEKAFEGLEPAARFHMVPDGEEIKNLQTFETLLSWLADEGADRKSVVVVLGGGVVGDLSGFVAASYMRGIDWIYVPTSLLAQQDAATGGKVAVNLPQGKNLVGQFWDPRAVIIDSTVLKTLPKRQITAGYMEFLKHGILESEELYREILTMPEDPDWDQWLPLLARGLKVKVNVVRQDPHEQGLRKVLNLGHTFGHALEAYGDYHLFLHGEAVGLGLIYVALLSHELGGSYDWSELINTVKRRTPPFDSSDWDRDALLDLTLLDKKGVAGVVSWIIPYEPGRVEIVKGIPRESLVKARDAFFKVME